MLAFVRIFFKAFVCSLTCPIDMRFFLLFSNTSMSLLVAVGLGRMLSLVWSKLDLREFLTDFLDFLNLQAAERKTGTQLP